MKIKMKNPFTTQDMKTHLNFIIPWTIILEENMRERERERRKKITWNWESEITEQNPLEKIQYNHKNKRRIKLYIKIYKKRVKNFLEKGKELARETDRKRSEHTRAMAYYYTKSLCVLTLFCQLLILLTPFPSILITFN